MSIHHNPRLNSRFSRRPHLTLPRHIDGINRRNLINEPSSLLPFPFSGQD